MINASVSARAHAKENKNKRRLASPFPVWIMEAAVSRKYYFMYSCTAAYNYQEESSHSFFFEGNIILWQLHNWSLDNMTYLNSHTFFVPLSQEKPSIPIIYSSCFGKFPYAKIWNFWYFVSTNEDEYNLKSTVRSRSIYIIYWPKFTVKPETKAIFNPINWLLRLRNA